MKMRKLVGGLMLAAQILGSADAVAGPWEDGMAAYNRGDYVPAIRVFRAMAEQGNAKAQSVLGAMYRRGQGVSRSPAAPSCGSAAPQQAATCRRKRNCARCRRP